MEESFRQRGQHVQRPGGEEEHAEPAGDPEAGVPAATPCPYLPSQIAEEAGI